MRTDVNIFANAFVFQKIAKTKVTEESKKARDELEKRFQKVKESLTTQVNSVKENLPDYSKLNAEYKNELQKLGDELLADKSIKELVDF